MIEHRRIAIAASAITTPDIDWAGTHTPPTAGDDLAAGEVRELSPGGSRVIWKYEVYDGMGDGALPVAPGTTTITIELVTRYRPRGLDTFSAGPSDANVAPQKRRIETEMGRTGLSTIRVTASANLPAAGALWIFADEGVTS